MAHSLFYEYAITPDVFDSGYVSSDPRLEIILPELLKGICENGMIANLNKGGWIKHLENGRIPVIAQQDLKDKILRYFTLLKDRNRLVRHPKASNGDPTTDIDWLNIALESHRLIEFDNIISSQQLLNSCGITCNKFTEALKVLSSPQWEGRKRTLTLASCEPYYRPVLDPVLRHAKSLTIVDPYFSPHSQKFIDFLKICIDQMGQRGTSILPGRIHIHAGDPFTDRDNPEMVDNRLASWESILKTLYPSSIPHKIKVFLRTKKQNGKKFHDRFILTDQCCIDIPMGTDMFGASTPQSTTWCLLDDDDRQIKADEIAPAMNIYALLGERQLIV